MQSFTFDGKKISIFPGADPDSPVIYLHTFGEEGAEVFQILHEMNCPDVSLVAITGLVWNHEMAPWDCPAVFAKGDAFTGGAETYLHVLTDCILPETEHRLGGRPVWRGIAGYSLAGLFAPYTLCRTDQFSRAASMSGSLWFPGFPEYLESHPLVSHPDCLYLSLGNKEHKTKNPLMRTVQSNTEQIVSYLRTLDIPVTFEVNEGGHFDQPAQRTAKGICWIAEQ